MPRLNPLLWPKPPVIWAYGIAVVSVAAAMIALQWPPLHNLFERQIDRDVLPYVREKESERFRLRASLPGDS